MTTNVLSVSVADSLWLERLTRVKFSLANTLVAMQVSIQCTLCIESSIHHIYCIAHVIMSTTINHMTVT